jgi:predicted KAP-like P-loop ATPase
MNAFFVDTFYWIAFTNVQDLAHERVKAFTVAEIIVQADGRPISIGISGVCGVGKSSMIKLVRRSLTHRSDKGKGDFIFVEFNAWFYQGYDDARAALMEVIGCKGLAYHRNVNSLPQMA